MPAENPAGISPMAFELETERLILNRWQESDAASYRQLVGERGGEMPTLDAARSKIISGRAASTDNGIATLPIRRRAEGDFIGYCGLITGRSTLEEPEIAYELLRSAHGNGYATEAASAVLAAAIATGRSRLWATVRTWNAPSFRVLEKLGFERRYSTWDDRGEIVWNVREL
jgi:RimJ/RimL family protein N-acetyltransferase